MQTNWTLTIDLHQYRDKLLLEFILLDGERRHRWKTGGDIFVEAFHQIAQNISGFFDHQAQWHKRQEQIDYFRWLGGRSFRLGELLKTASFSRADTLTINTLVTAIPWDLVPYEDDYLGHIVSVGLKIPTSRHNSPLSGTSKKQPRFLHVVSNPYGDLPRVADEAQALKALVEAVEGLDYELVKDPTPSELIRNFGSGRSTPVLHFTGHVLPQKGLLLHKGVLGVEDIITYFPSEREQVVFLNGCDAAHEPYEYSADGAPDLFQSATVANAFLDAGAEAVIAPRSRIADGEACGAAERMWELIFKGELLGAVVRDFRQESVRTDPSALAGYSYILYGDPVRQLPLAMPPAPRHRGITEETTLVGHEILREAWGDARGPVAPRHIFAALTRRWVLGRAFFDIEGQQYILALERLRSEVGGNSPPSPPPEGVCEYTPAGNLVVSRASERRVGAGLDDLALLEGLALVGDPEVTCALESLRRGPRDLTALVQSARQWAGRERPVPAVVIEPSGFLNPSIFPRDFLPDTHMPLSADAVDHWDLFAALVSKGENCSRLWAGLGLNAPPSVGWTAGHPLHWARLTDSLRHAIFDLLTVLENERDCVVTEGRLLACLANKHDFLWLGLPADAREYLSAHGFDRAGWESLLDVMRLKSLSWI